MDETEWVTSTDWDGMLRYLEDDPGVTLRTARLFRLSLYRTFETQIQDRQAREVFRRFEDLCNGREINLDQAMHAVDELWSNLHTFLHDRSGRAEVDEQLIGSPRNFEEIQRRHHIADIARQVMTWDPQDVPLECRKGRWEVMRTLGSITIGLHDSDWGSQLRIRELEQRLPDRVPEMDMARQLPSEREQQCIQEELRQLRVQEDQRRMQRRNSVLADRIRDIFGNPFRHVSEVPSEWLTSEVIDPARVARATLDAEDRRQAIERVYDALFAAGCDDTQILLHLDEPHHDRCCWVLELLRK